MYGAINICLILQYCSPDLSALGEDWDEASFVIQSTRYFGCKDLHVYFVLADGRKNGIRRNTKNGRHGTLQRRIAGGYEEAVVR